MIQINYYDHFKVTYKISEHSDVCVQFWVWAGCRRWLGFPVNNSQSSALQNPKSKYANMKNLTKPSIQVNSYDPYECIWLVSFAGKFVIILSNIWHINPKLSDSIYIIIHNLMCICLNVLKFLQMTQLIFLVLMVHMVLHQHV